MTRTRRESGARAAAPPATVRRARHSDLRALAQLCRAAVGADDYVLYHLPEMVAAREVLVAEVAGRIVAMVGLLASLDRGLWLGQARTHPDFRRQGYARLLFEAAWKRARRERRPAVRLWTSERNTAAHRVARGAGYRRVAVFTRRVARPLAGASGLDRSDRVDHAFRLWRRGAFSRDGRGYLAYAWHFLPLTRAALRTMTRRGELLDNEEAAVIICRGEEQEGAVVSILAGGGAALRAARQAAHERGFRRVQTFLPRAPRMTRWARRAGFRRGSWGTRAVLYERRV